MDMNHNNGCDTCGTNWNQLATTLTGNFNQVYKSERHNNR